MSAYHPIADIAAPAANGREVPTTAVSRRSKPRAYSITSSADSCATETNDPKSGPVTADRYWIASPI